MFLGIESLSAKEMQYACKLPNGGASEMESSITSYCVFTWGEWI